MGTAPQAWGLAACQSCNAGCRKGSGRHHVTCYAWLQEKQRELHSWASAPHGADLSKQGARADAALLASFCTSRPDTAHLAQCFASLAARKQGLSEHADDGYLMQSHVSSAASQRVEIGDEAQVDGEGDDSRHITEEPAAPQTWQHDLNEAMDELIDKCQAVLNLPPAQV